MKNCRVDPRSSHFLYAKEALRVNSSRDPAVVPQNNAHSTVFRMPACIRITFYGLWLALQSNLWDLSGSTKKSTNMLHNQISWRIERGILQVTTQSIDISSQMSRHSQVLNKSPDTRKKQLGIHNSMLLKYHLRYSLECGYQCIKLNLELRYFRYQWCFYSRPESKLKVDLYT